MSEKQEVFIISLLLLSVACLVIPAVITALVSIIGRMGADSSRQLRKKPRISRPIAFSACLLACVWCLRYAVGYFAILCPELIDPEATAPALMWWEEIFNSIAHALQTFSMDEDYTDYIINGRIMLRAIFGEETGWDIAYGIYASVLNVVAPIAGGAIILDILASIFPKLRLHLYYMEVWREKYYFSKLNAASLTLAKSICALNRSLFKKPVIIFTDACVDDEDRKYAELAIEAKGMGAVCVRDDLPHVEKCRVGNRRYFLIDESDACNLHTLTDLTDAYNSTYLKKTEIYLFTNSDAYVQIEKIIRDKLEHELHFTEEEQPVFVPVQRYRNMISNLLVDVPLYEPLMGKQRNEDGTQDLTVTILGTGQIGTEMFLSTYWFGQILNCNLKINVLSQETEEEFWGKIDYVNPEIKHTTIKGDPILRYNRKDEPAPVYCTVNYRQCDMKSSKFIKCLTDEKDNILDTDYYFVALGSDEDNISVANTVRKFVGQHHISTESTDRTVIAYVVFETELAATLNRKKQYRSFGDGVDVYMCAVGSLGEVYGAANVFMTEHEHLTNRAHQGYLSARDQAKRAETHKKRMKDDYKHWASRARAMHIKYKIFSMGMMDVSALDFENTDNPVYLEAVKEVYRKYEEVAAGRVIREEEQDADEHLKLLHKMAWLEHRRWNAFTRIMGFRHTDRYGVYAAKNVEGSYKQMDLKLHPCLVECDQQGIRASITKSGLIDEKTVFKCKDRSGFDLLDELSYDLHDGEYNSYDMKQYDYPKSDF